MTNGEKIRAMTDDELAKFILGCVSCDSCPFFSKCTASRFSCIDFIKRWIKETAIRGEHE